MKLNHFNFNRQFFLIPIFFFWVLMANAQGGTWTPVTRLSNGLCYGSMLLQSDGSVIVLTNNQTTKSWEKLTPDASGSYVNGTWSNIALMNYARYDFASQVLKDGRTYVAGGEYGDPGRDSNGEIYDPLTNTWTMVYPNLAIGDGNSEILSDGSVLQGASWANGGCKIYYPSTNTFSSVFYQNYNSDEASWTKLPDGSILTVGLGSTSSERYIPSLGKWVADANVPVNLYDAAGEMGGSFLLPNGKAIFFGAHQNGGTRAGHTAIYTPSGNNNPGSWAVGPDFPGAFGQQDGGGAMMINGKILLQASQTANDGTAEFQGPSYFYEYDYVTNSFAQVSAPSSTSNSIPNGSYQGYFLCLPNGQVLWASFQWSNRYWIYTPSGAAIAAGKPTISTVTPNSCTTYTVTGTLFGGISEGVGYGDDEQAFTNFPIVKLTSGSNVYYARTFNWSTRSVMTGTAQCSTQFTLPAGLPVGTYSMVLSVNGFSSAPYTLTTTSCTTGCTAPQNVVATSVSPSSENISWANSGATSYYIQYKKSTDATWGTPITGITGTNYTLTGLAAATLYNVAVNSTCANGTTLVTNSSFTTANATATCTAPQNVVAASVSSSSENISWAASGATGYYLWYQLSGASSWTGPTPTSSSTNYTLTGLTAGKAYNVDVYSVCADGTYPVTHSNFTTANATATCTAPQNVVATSVSSSSENISWAASGATNYYLFYQLSGAGSWTGPTPFTSSTNYTLTGLTAGKAYNVDVYSVCANGTYPVTHSSFTTANATATCTAPQNVVATPVSSSSENISWINSGGSSYYIYYKKSTDIYWGTPITGVTGNNSTLTGLSAGTLYNLDVYSMCPNGNPVTHSSFTTSTAPSMSTGSSAISIFPNPTQSTLQIAGLPAKTVITLFNSSGQKLKTIVSIKNFETIDISQFAKGLYILKIDGQDGTNFSNFKVVKN